MAPKKRKASSDEFSESHYQVAEILSQLPDLITEFDYTPISKVYWGCKGTRTAIKSTPLTAAEEENAPLTSTIVTPLVSLSNEPEEKLDHFKRKRSPARQREDLSPEFVNFSRVRESLKAKLRKLRVQCEELKVKNLELKAEEQKSSVGDEKENTHIDIGLKNSAAETSEIPEEHNQTIECQDDLPSSNENQTAETSGQKSSPEEYSGMAWPRITIVMSIRRMIAAEARQQRLEKIRRVKSSIALRKPPQHILKSE